MKRLGLIFGIMGISFIALLASSNSRGNQNLKPGKRDNNAGNDSYGPNGELIHVGSGGGRYYMRKNKKVYIGHKQK